MLISHRSIWTTGKYAQAFRRDYSQICVSVKIKISHHISGGTASRRQFQAVMCSVVGVFVSEIDVKGKILPELGRARHGVVEYHLGMAVVELGHDGSEMPAVDLLAEILRRSLRKAKKKVRVATWKRPRAARTI